MTKLIRRALALCHDRWAPLVAIATAITVPIAAIVLVLDLIAWRSLDPGREGVVERELGDTVRAVDPTRFTTIAVARYALGGLAYLLVAAIAYRPLRAALPVDRSRPEPHGRARAAGALVAGVGLVAAVRVLLSTAGAIALAATATSGALVYLGLMNAVHALGKIVTAPFLAALVVVVDSARRRRVRRGRDA